ncbi:glycosyltransferase family 2 protein [Salegentibacter sp. F188]|uniref:Glycosyltransferase family 2 protein n=1 Tax=Autumnicola patrickiae TaxID=3075591 RepID=A0ABU3DYT4_9FLAO|nr:glycosyltransferase family 2 protein [Salegentibacter sp. F188]MDT0688604.1 glycosyltransferase family 2 protein [Salegentibacter sp. F188]
MPQLEPLISIIIPTFNRCEMIGQTLDSILAQTNQRWECFVIDDGSTDNTEQLMSFYCGIDSRIKYYTRPEDMASGANACRNYGIDVSQGDYIKFFDSDDLMFPSLLAEEIKIIENQGEVNIISCGFEKFTDKEMNSPRSYNVNLTDDILKDFCFGNLVLNTPSLLYSREIIGNTRFDEKLCRAQDLDFGFKILIKNQMKHIPLNKVQVKVRVHQLSISGNYLNRITSEALLSELKVRKDIAEFLFKKRSEKEAQQSILYYFLVYRQMLLSKRYKLFFYNLSKHRSFCRRLKWKLLLIGLVFVLTGRGETKFSNEVKLTLY